MGGGGFQAETTDGGNVWTSNPISPERQVFSVSYPVEESIGFACGEKGLLIKTTTSGVSWENIPKPNADSIPYVCISFKSNESGLILDSSGRIFRTQDGGITWEAAVPAQGFKANSVEHLNGSSWISVGDSGRVAISTDDGLNWVKSQPIPENFNNLKKIKLFGNGSFGYAIGDSGVVYQYSSGTWILRPTQVKSRLYDVAVHPDNRKIAWIAGEGGTILYTQNNGSSWLRINAPLSDDILSIALVNEARGWMGTRSGRMLQLLYDPSRPYSPIWKKNSGVFINDTYPVNPLTKGVASFDGLNQYGKPYSLVGNAVRYCDTLTSVAINLEGQAASGVNLSFYYQAGGNAIQLLPNPNEGDFFEVQFKSPSGKWESKWQKQNPSSNGKASPFLFASILLPDSFCYNGFQFRFMNFGDPTGNYDIWNLDYVRLSTSSDSISSDVASSLLPGTFFKNYRALPLEHFKALHTGSRLSGFVSDSIHGQAINMNKGPLVTPVDGNFFIYKNSPAGREEILNIPSSNFLGLELALSPDLFRKKISVLQNQVLSTVVSAANEYSTFEYGFRVRGQSDNTNTYQENDTLLNSVNLSTLLAADDGSAELIRGGGNNLAKGAVRFFLPETDTITDISLYFPRTALTFTQTISFTLILWDSINAETNFEKPIFRLPVILPPVLDSLNKFDYFNLRIRPLNQRILQGGRHFFIGWQQGIIDNGNEVFLGCDINSRFPQSFYYNDDGADWRIWQKDDFPLMIRPVFGPNVQVSVKDKHSKPGSAFFPNPSLGSIKNKEAIRNLCLFNHLGQLLESRDLLEAEEEFVIRKQAGFYFLKWQEMNGNWVSQKIVVQ